MKLNIIPALLMAVIALVSCKPEYKVPTTYTTTTKQVRIYPDYTNIVIPSNIAPMNFMVRSEGDGFVVVLKSANQEIVTGASSDAKVLIDSVAWRNLLKSAMGKSIDVTVYAHNADAWIAYPSFHIQVAEPIDAYLSYRLIEPGYELYRQLGLYQRNLTTYDVYAIYENNRKYNEGENHCINCHNYQNNNAHTMLFHVRGNMGGTLIAKDGKVEKMNMKSDSIISSAVYPAWHPTHNWIVFSSNKTGQTFHLLNKEKVEVLDHSSDLIFYNADTKEVSNILKTATNMETFPCWSPSGDKLYYCDAYMPRLAELPDSMHSTEVVFNYRNIHYNLMSVSFDAATQTFGKPQLEFDAAKYGMSVSVPRVSPDGKYVLFTMADYGQFHIWHKSADLYVKDLQKNTVYPMIASNSKNVDSFHSWSSNSRWFVFSSRRDDGSFTRSYIAYFDKEGKSHKAFMLPQEDPEQSLVLFKSYNVPELTRNAVPYTFEQFRDAIYNHDGANVTYKEIRKK